MSRSNEVINPRAHVNATDGFEDDLSGGDSGAPQRVTSPPVALPAGADACFYGMSDGGYWLETDSKPLPPGIAAGDYIAVQMEVFWDDIDDDDGWLDLGVGFNLDGADFAYREFVNNDVNDEPHTVTHPLPLDGFHRYTGVIQVPANCNQATVYATANNKWWSSGSITGAKMYVTNMQLEAALEGQTVVGSYRDGDSNADWEWEGTAHASRSEGAPASNDGLTLISALHRENRVSDPQMGYGTPRAGTLSVPPYTYNYGGLWVPGYDPGALTVEPAWDQRIWVAAAAEVDVVTDTPWGMPANVDHALKLKPNANGTFDFGNDLQSGQTISDPIAAVFVQPGHTYVVSVWVAAVNPPSGEALEMVTWLISGPDDYEHPYPTPGVDWNAAWLEILDSELTPGWHRFFCSFTAPPWAETCEMWLFDAYHNWTDADARIYISGAQIEETDYTGATWQRNGLGDSTQGYDNGAGWTMQIYEGRRSWSWSNASPPYEFNDESIVPVVGGYGDGDRLGWTWDVGAHRSPSRSGTDAGVLINGGATMVFQTQVTLTLNPGPVAATQMALKNEGDDWGDWEPYQETKPWLLLAGNPGPRQVWAKYQDGTYVTTDVYATTELIARPPMGGQGVDVLDAEWTIDRHGGFTSATLEVVPPQRLARFADDVNEPVEIRDTNHHLLWEGRLEEPDLDFVEAERWTVEATGYVGYLEDDEYFRRTYVDNSLTSWQTDQATRYADRFSVGIEDDDKLVLRVACYGGDPGQVLADGMNCRAYWQLFDGVTTTQQITAFKFHYLLSGLDTSLRCRLYGRDQLSGGSVNRLIWTAPAEFDDEDDVSLDANDIGDDVRVLVFKFDQVGSTITEYTDLSSSVADWSLFSGIAYSDLRVFASDLNANVTPERVVRDAVLTLVDDDHIDFPDTSGFTLEHVDFGDPTTVGQAVQDMNAMLDWDWGFEDGQSFFFRKPWTVANVPMSELIVTSFVDPCLVSWDVRRSYQDCYNKVVAHYLKPSGRMASVTVSDEEGPLGNTWRTKFLDLTDTCNNATDATTVATAYLRDGLWPKPTGSATIVDYAHLAAGIDVPAIYLRPGMRVVNLDLAPEDGGRMLVTSVTGSLLQRQITLEVGTLSNRMDRLLARRELGAKRKKRRKKAR